jgi:Lrp/AsnC family leucine-responsive transcriptional regulator
MIIIAKFKNRKELSNFLKKDLSMPDIERTNTHIVLITVKEDFRFMDSLQK